MKKLFVICSLLFSLAGSMMAQDIITTKEGKEIQAKVLEINQTEIKYLDFENQDGPTYVLNKADVVLIRYQNGKNEVFTDSSPSQNDTSTTNTSATITEGMQYTDYKNLYDYHKYTHQYGDSYNPTLAGLASFIIPGLGQGVCDEWGRGAVFFGGHLLCLTGTYVFLTATARDHSAKIISPVILIAGSAATLAIDIASIVDAVHVAKIKNMYYQDLHGQQASVQMSLIPCVTYINTPDANTPVVGLSLNLGF